MKKLSFILFFISINCLISYSQVDLWESFYDEKTELIGFKDKSKKIRIKPKFDDFMIARYFDKIIVVSEPPDSLYNYQIYYLLKNGLKFGQDSIFNFDNYPDCESEGFIRFHDKKSDKMGFFDGNGNAAISAIYNFMTPFRNGLAIALMNAEKKCSHPVENIKDCEHWDWINGKEVLIDTNNDILVENFRWTNELDWFSVEISESIGDTTIKDYFRGTNGKYYSFLNFRKEFTDWFHNVFLKSDDILEYCYSEISFYQKGNKEKHYRNPKKFIKENKKLLLNKLDEIRNGKLEINIFVDGLPPKKIHEQQSLKYFDYCGNYKSWLFPIFNVVVTFNDSDGKFAYQEHYDFIRTEYGYKLFALSLKDFKK
ncbi:MAG: WG repeat-containing protein [bacterium]